MTASYNRRVAKYSTESKRSAGALIGIVLTNHLRGPHTNDEIRLLEE